MDIAQLKSQEKKGSEKLSLTRRTTGIDKEQPDNCHNNGGGNDKQLDFECEENGEEREDYEVGGGTCSQQQSFVHSKTRYSTSDDRIEAS